MDSVNFYPPSLNYICLTCETVFVVFSSGFFFLVDLLTAEYSGIGGETQSRVRTKKHEIYYACTSGHWTGTRSLFSAH